MKLCSSLHLDPCVAMAATSTCCGDNRVHIDGHRFARAVRLMIWLHLEQALLPGASSSRAGVIRRVRCAPYKGSEGRKVPAVENWEVRGILNATDKHQYINIDANKWPADCDPNELLLLCLFLTTSDNPWQTIGALLLTAKFVEGTSSVQVGSFRKRFPLVRMLPQLPAHMKLEEAFEKLHLDLAMFQQESANNAFQHLHPNKKGMFFGLMYLRKEGQLSLGQMAPTAHTPTGAFQLKAYVGEIQVGV
jgi:hypothetical protein